MYRNALVDDLISLSSVIPILNGCTRLITDLMEDGKQANWFEISPSVCVSIDVGFYFVRIPCLLSYPTNVLLKHD